jgi:hypothetical protein
MKAVTLTEMAELSATQIGELKDKLTGQELILDTETFQPYKELDGKRYYVEALTDAWARGEVVGDIGKL